MKIKPDAYSLVHRQPMATDATFLVCYRAFSGNLSAGGHGEDDTYLAIGDIVALTQRTQIEDPPESAAYPVRQLVALDSSAEAEYSPWGDVPSVVDIALDVCLSMAYLLTETRQILVYALDTERVLSFIQLDVRGGDAVGIHRLATPITIATGAEE